MTDNSSVQGGAIMNAINQVKGLFSGVNKTNSIVKDSIIPEDEYESSYSEEEVISLTKDWEKTYFGYYAEIEKRQDKFIKYWLGKQQVDIQDTLDNRNIVTNQLFKAVETFLPIATRSNPEPLVAADQSDEGQKLAKDVKDTLVYQADQQILRRKLARMTRHWLLYLIGAIEVEYDEEIDDIKTSVINPKKFIFDKDGYIDEEGHFIGEYLGLKLKASASRLKILFPKKSEYIDDLAKGRMGTKLEYRKWWYKNTDVFFTLNGRVLGKYKNPHWNYDGEIKRTDAITGVEITEQVIGRNHLSKPLAPYVFLSIFNIGQQPHDETGLIEQNIAQQDQINKRYRQLDKNIDGQNNGVVVDGRFVTQEQAALAAAAKRQGAAIRVNGNPKEVISFDSAPQLASDVWHSVEKAESNLENIFGTSGSNPEGIKSEESARGKILVNQLDASRIGGGITEYIEQVADSIYNLWVQMMIVHYDEAHYVNILGVQEGGEDVALINSDFTHSLNVTVKEGSLVPKDPLTQRNEAIDLWSANAIDPLNLYKKLDFPDPNAATQSLILWQMLQKGQIQPQMYLPNFQIGQPEQPGILPTEQPGTGGPAINPGISQETGAQPPAPATPEAVQQQGQQLLQSIPVK